MKADVKKVDGIKREILIEAEGERVRNKFEDVFKSLSETVKVPGFRQGHVPRDILEKNYAQLVHEQVLRELIPDLYKEAVAEQKLDVVELPEISEVKLERTRLVFKATVSVTPEIKLPNYKGIKLKYKAVIVADDELARMLDSIKESRKLDVIDDSWARGLGYPDLAAMRDALHKQLFIQKQNQQRQDLEAQVIAAVTKDFKTQFPQSLVDRQLEELLRQAKLDLALKGLPKEDIESRQEQMRTELEPQARRQVVVYLVLSAIAKQENIKADEQVTERVLEFLLRNALWTEEK